MKRKPDSTSKDVPWPSGATRRPGEPSTQTKARSRNQSSGTPSSSKLWAGRFREKTHRLVERFTSSCHIDRRLYRQDIRGSIAHCRTLQRAGVLTARETTRIIRGLERVHAELDRRTFQFLDQDEDIHMAIERRLTELIGPVGGKLHTGRSRNDQIALDTRLYVREALTTLLEELTQFQKALLQHARSHIAVVFPGYTHLQRAQPVLWAHHLLAYVEMAERDKGRLRDAMARVNVMPLGSGALAGTNYPVDRSYTAQLLGFPAVSQNSLDAVSDRDFVIEVSAGLAGIMVHLSRLSEELILWSSQEFNFVELPDSFCTGSSMMPQKKNPDVPELVRGKAGRVFGHLVSVLTMMKGLPLSYNRDLQEDKDPLFDALDTVSLCLEITTELINHVELHPHVMAEAAESDALLATDLADYLVLKGMPFREAHETIGRVVRTCLEKRRELSGITLDELRSFSTRFGGDALDLLCVQRSVDRKNQVGGTSRKQVEARLKAWQKVLR